MGDDCDYNNDNDDALLKDNHRKAVGGGHLMVSEISNASWKQEGKLGGY